jgi:hypothetical protein
VRRWSSAPRWRGAARCSGHANIALPREVVTSRGPCPPSRR